MFSGGKGTGGDLQDLAHICNVTMLISELQRGGELGEEVNHQALNYNQMEAKGSRVSPHRTVMTENNSMLYISKNLEEFKVISPQT